MDQSNYTMRHARHKKKSKIPVILLTVFLIISMGGFITVKNKQMSRDTFEDLSIQVDLLPVNNYSRPAKRLQKVKGIVVHYTANPQSSAKANRDYFASLAKTHKTKASSHFVIGLEGEIIQCIPTREIAYASNNRNGDTISIECCHEESSGRFNKATYVSLVNLTRALMNKYHLSSQQVIRHYDVTGKLCPLYFVENPEEWESFKEDLNGWSFFDYLRY